MELVEELGSDAFVHATVAQDKGKPVVLIARVDPASPPAKGSSLWLAPEGPVHAFDTQTGRRLSV